MKNLVFVLGLFFYINILAHEAPVNRLTVQDQNGVYSKAYPYLVATVTDVGGLIIQGKDATNGSAYCELGQHFFEKTAMSNVRLANKINNHGDKDISVTCHYVNRTNGKRLLVKSRVLVNLVHEHHTDTKGDHEYKFEYEVNVSYELDNYRNLY
jgi:hypothetical protein